MERFREPMTEFEKRHLDEQGYLVIQNLMGVALVDDIRRRVDELFELEGAGAGSEFKQEPHSRRLANLVDKGEVFERVIQTPRVLDCMEHVLGAGFKLSSLNVRSADPDNHWTQPLHADSGAVADERGYWVCNSVWMLDDFTPENGAIRMVPGSHRWGRAPDPDQYGPHPDEILLTGRAGDVVVMNAHMWHGGTSNRTAAHRRAMHVYYTRWDKPQQQYQKRLLRPETQARLNATSRKLLALDDPLNDELSAELSGMSGFLK
jgi:ectoine hydroxylase-related dioxygenase (phytanoyl-CoA dioxygenase family)